MNRIGERIKAKRGLMNLHLNELAEKVGISASALSQIEKSKSTPSLHTLKSIADALHTTIGELVGENESMANNPVVHKNEMKYMDKNQSGTIIYMLSNHDASKQMDTYLVRLGKTSGIEDLLPSTNGQIFCHILSGEVRFDLGDKSYILNQGDNIYFNAKQTHNAVNTNDSISEMIWVQSPPNF